MMDVTTANGMKFCQFVHFKISTNYIYKFCWHFMLSIPTDLLSYRPAFFWMREFRCIYMVKWFPLHSFHLLYRTWICLLVLWWLHHTIQKKITAIRFIGIMALKLSRRTTKTSRPTFSIIWSEFVMKWNHWFASIRMSNTVFFWIGHFRRHGI